MHSNGGRDPRRIAAKIAKLPELPHDRAALGPRLP
jgi:hypothetical protein